MTRCLAVSGVVGLLCAFQPAAGQTPAAPPAQAPPAPVLLDHALDRAKAEGKVLLVEFGASWCVPCRRLNALLDAPEVKPIIDEHFVVLRLTVWENKDKIHLNNTGAEAMLAKWVGGSGIPQSAVLDRNGVPLGAFGGYPGTSDSIEEFTALVERTAPGMSADARRVLVVNLQARADPLGSVQGRITDELGAPVVGAPVVLAPMAYVNGAWAPVAGRRVVTDEAGRYELSGVAPGTYRVVVESLAGTGQEPMVMTPTFHPGTVTAAAARPVVLNRGQDLPGVDVSVLHAAPARVSGTLLSAGGGPFANVSVTLTNADWPAASHTSTAGADGVFAIPGVPPGRYHLWATGSSGGAIETAFQRVEVSTADVTGLRIAATRGGAVAGRLIFDGPPLVASDRDAIRITAVATTPVAGAPRGAPASRIGPNGTFEIGGLFGARVLRIDGLPRGRGLKVITAAGRDVTDAPIDFTAGLRLTDAQVVVTTGSAGLTGRVVNGGGVAMIQGAVVIFAADPARWSYPSRFVRLAPIQQSGEFEASDLPPGQYLAAVVETVERAWNAPEALERLREQATAVVLNEFAQTRVALIAPIILALQASAQKAIVDSLPVVRPTVSILGEVRDSDFGGWNRFVTDAALSPNGRLIAFTVRDELRVWNTVARTESLLVAGGAHTFTWAPNGDAIVMTHRDAQDPDRYLWTIRVDPESGNGLEPKRLVSRMSINHAPFYSPDQRWIAFAQATPDSSNPWRSSLVVVPAGGGPERVLAGALDDIKAIRWSPDGAAINYVAGAGVSSPARQEFRVSLHGGPPVKIGPPPSGWPVLRDTTTGEALASVAIPPDITVTDWSGRNVLAGVREVRPRGLRIVNLADGTIQDLVDSSADAGVPAWFANGNRIASDREGLSPDGQTMATMPAAGPASPIGAQMTLLSLKDSITRRIRLPFIQIAGIYWHPDGQRVFVLGREKPRGPVNVYSVPINGDAPSVIAPVGSSRQESALVVSPDGRFIAFTVAGTPSATFLRLDFSR